MALLTTPGLPRIAAAALVAVWAAGAGAQTVSAPELKAAFVFNFAKFAEWPTHPPDAPITLCVSGDDRLATALAATARAQGVDARSVVIARLTGDTSARSCQVLYLASGSRRAGALLDESGALPVLTVGDGDRFAESGGMIGLFIDEGRMRFAVNVDAVQRARIHLSSRLLGLARIVRESHAP